MSNISGLFIRIERLYVSHLLALNSAQVVLSVRNTHASPLLVYNHAFKSICSIVSHYANKMR